MSVPLENQVTLGPVRPADALAFVNNPDPMALQAVLTEGDLSKLKPEHKLQFVAAVSRSLGLNPLTKPFDFIHLNGKLQMYARKDATDQLRKLHKVSVQIVDRKTDSDVHIVRARAKMPDGREDEAIGALSVLNLKGEALANALMKCETKAKRRVTLSICGLGFLDESELEGTQERKQATGAIHDPWSAPEPEPQEPALELETANAEEYPAWQELYPRGWREWLTSTGDYPEDLIELLRLWNKQRHNPGLCAAAATWIGQTIVSIASFTWDEIQQEIEGIPDMINDCTPEQLYQIAAMVKRVQASEERRRS